MAGETGGEQELSRSQGGIAKTSVRQEDMT